MNKLLTHTVLLFFTAGLFAQTSNDGMLYISVGIENLVNVSVFPPVELYSVTKRCKVGGLLITNPMIYQKTK